MSVQQYFDYQDLVSSKLIWQLQTIWAWSLMVMHYIFITDISKRTTISCGELCCQSVPFNFSLPMSSTSQESEQCICVSGDLHLPFLRFLDYILWLFRHAVFCLFYQKHRSFKAVVSYVVSQYHITFHFQCDQHFVLEIRNFLEIFRFIHILVSICINFINILYPHFTRRAGLDI